MTTKLGIIPAVGAIGYKERKCNVWTCLPKELPVRTRIESTGELGLRLEMQTLLERYIGQTLEVCVYEAGSEGSKTACEIVRNLIHCRTIYCKGKIVWCNPFATPFRGETTINFNPPWHIKAKRESSQRGVDPDDYATSGTRPHWTIGDVFN